METGAKFQVPFNLASCSNYSITIYDKIPVFQFFEKVIKARLQMVKKSLKMARSCYILILIKS